MRLPWISLVCCLPFLELNSAGEGWPEFRGPTGQGRAGGTAPLRWETSGDFAWETPLPGGGWSSPVTDGGQVVVTAALSNATGGVDLAVIGLNLEDGKILWQTTLFSRAEPGQLHRKNGHASPTPILEGDRIYAHFGHYGTACLTKDGKAVWKNDSLGYSPVHGNGGSPALFEDRLIFSADGGSDPFIAALNKKTGAVIWKVPRVTTAKKTFSFSTPLVVEVDGKPQVVTAGSGLVAGLDPADGREIWRARYGEGYSVVPRPVREGNLIYISSGYDRPSAYGIELGGSGDVTGSHVRWSVARGAPNTPSMIVDKGLLFMVSDAGIASCLNAADGTAHWQERLGGDFSSSPVECDGRIYFTNESGVTTVVKASSTFEVLAKNDLKERTLASAAFVEGDILMRTENRLIRIKGRR